MVVRKIKNLFQQVAQSQTAFCLRDEMNFIHCLGPHSETMSQRLYYFPVFIMLFKRL